MVEKFPCGLTDEEWRRRLAAETYRVLRRSGTEKPGSSPLNDEKRQGVFRCAGCGHPLFSSADKFDSGTGWPSFTQPIQDGAIGFSTDDVLGYPRKEAHCANCGGHLGHVFDDGPPPTGKRHCINGLALDFKPS
jgi:peptide-methionine (R)-S-oxide reductase